MSTPNKPLHHHLLDYFFPHERNNYRPHLFSATSVAALVLAVIAFEGAYLVQTKFVFFKTDFLASVLPGALVSLTNQDRAVYGLAGVTENALLDKAAQAIAQDMAAREYFAHISPEGKTPWQWLDQVGYAYSYAGQNLAINFTDSTDVETAWMGSPTHRANIMKQEYTQVGFGTANGTYQGKATTFVVEFFATPASKVATLTPAAPVQKSGDTHSVPATTKVLGSQAVAVNTSDAAAPASWLTRLLASPLHTLMALFTVVFAVIAVALVFAVMARGRVQHPSVLIGGTLLLALIGTSMLLSSELTNSPKLIPGAQVAAVGSVLLN